MDKSDILAWIMVPVWTLGGFAMLFVIAGLIEGVQYLRRLPYKAQEIYDARCFGGLDGLRSKKRVQLFMNTDALTIKPWFKSAIVIPWEKVIRTDWLLPFMDEPNLVWIKRGLSGERQERDAEDILKKVRFRETKKYLMLYYRHEGHDRVACMGFRYGDHDNVDFEAFYRCSESLHWYKEHSRRANPKDAVGTVNLRKKSNPRAERMVWQADPETGQIRSSWKS